MPKRADGGCDDIADDKRYNRLLGGDDPASINAPAAANPEANSAVKLKTTRDRASMGIKVVVTKRASQSRVISKKCMELSIKTRT